MTLTTSPKWRGGKLGDFLPIKYGKSLPARLRALTGTVPVFGSSGRVGTHSEALTQGPALIVGRKGSVGSVYYSEVPCWPIDTVYYAEAAEGQDLRYFQHLLDSLRLVRLDKSTAVPGLGRDDYNSVPVTIAPPDEQRRIVAEIEKQFSRLDEAIANLKRVKANLKRYKASVLKAAVEGRLVPTEAELARRESRSYETGGQLVRRILEARRKQFGGRGKYREPTETEYADLPEVPDGWAWASTEQLSAGERHALAIGPFGSSLKVSDYTSSGVPLVFVRNIRAASFEHPANVFVSEAKGEKLQAHRVQAGDLLITKMGAPPGDACLYPAHRPPAVITADCIKLRPSPILQGARFLLCAIQSKLVQRQILSVTKGVAQLKVSLGRFATIGIPLPPLPEQRRIVAEVDRRLSIVREVESEVDANLKRAQALRQGVLARAFAPPPTTGARQGERAAATP